MKKILLLIIYILGIKEVMATSIDVTNDTELKFKWYKDEVIDSKYYPKKDDLPGYIEDSTKIQYGDYSDWSVNNCDYDEANYLIERKPIITYEKLKKVKYVWFQTTSAVCRDPNCLNDFELYYNHQKIAYTKLAYDFYGVLLELPMLCDPENLLVYIDSDYGYAVFFSTEKYAFDIYTQNTTEKIVVMDNTWLVGNDNLYTLIETESEVPSIPLIRNITRTETCRVREINTYRYKTEKEYYDDEYHTHIDGYLPDMNDYVINYTKEFPITTIETIKEVPITKTEKEYIYLTESQENDSESEKTSNLPTNEHKETIVYQTQYKDKIIAKIPSKIYTVIIVMLIIIIIETIKIIAKKVD